MCLGAAAHGSTSIGASFGHRRKRQRQPAPAAAPAQRPLPACRLLHAASARSDSPAWSSRMESPMNCTVHKILTWPLYTVSILSPYCRYIIDRIFMIPLALSRSPSAYSYIGVPANRARSGAGGTSRVASLFALATPYPKAPRRAPARGTSMGRRSVPGGVPARAAPTPPRRRGVACPAMRAANSSGRTFAQEKRGARFT